MPIRLLGLMLLCAIVVPGYAAHAEGEIENVKKMAPTQLKLCEAALFKEHPHADMQLMAPTGTRAMDGKLIISLPFVETLSMDTRFNQFQCRFDGEKLIDSQ